MKRNVLTRREMLAASGGLQHVSQHAAEWFSYHQKMDEFRGFQVPAWCRYAEAFMRQGYSTLHSESL